MSIFKNVFENEVNLFKPQFVEKLSKQWIRRLYEDTVPHLAHVNVASFCRVYLIFIFVDVIFN